MTTQPTTHQELALELEDWFASRASAYDIVAGVCGRLARVATNGDALSEELFEWMSEASPETCLEIVEWVVARTEVQS